MGGTFQLPRDARSTPGVHLAFNFGSIVGVGFRGHHEAVAVYPHITSMEGEMDLCWGHRQEQVGPCASRDGPQRTLCPALGCPACGSQQCRGHRLTAALSSSISRVAEAGALLLPEPSVEALPAAPHCGHSTALAARGLSWPCPLCCPHCTGCAHACPAPTLHPQPRRRL